MLERAAQLAPWLQEFDAAHAVSAIDLAHHLALRRQDLRGLQQALSRLDVSSLGRAETHVLGSLHRLAGKPWTALRDSEPVGARRGPAELQRNARGLLGPPAQA